MRISINTKKAMLALCMTVATMAANAQSNSNRIGLGVGAMYERGLDATLTFEHETRNHNAWEYFGNYYIKYDKDPDAGHITKESFWNNYKTLTLGIAYKPCVYRGKNNYGALRIGASGGTDTDEFVGVVHLGYEHDYALRNGWKVYWQVKTDMCINGKDLLKAGVALGFRLPVDKR